MASSFYNPRDFGQKEVELRSKFFIQMEDARNYFLTVVKPRLDRSYKLYIGYTGDRRQKIQPWQSNVFVPYTQAVIETLMPRVLDARPEFSVIGRTEDDHLKSEKQQQLADYFWEIAGMDQTAEDVTRSSVVYGTGFMQVSWKKDVRELKFLDTKDINARSPKWKKEKKTFYDAPYAEWVDNYSLWYDWHNTSRHQKQYWFKRLVLTEEEIRRRYPMAEKKRLELALNAPGGDLTDYASVRQMVKSTHSDITRSGSSSGVAFNSNGSAFEYSRWQNTDGTMKLYEVFEWWRPYDDEYAVIVGGSYVPIFKGGSMPIPYDFKEAPFIDIPYMRIPGEFEGYGVPLILENPQILTNTIKNQRVDATTLSIHKMWIVNPLANINKNELVTRPFGIIYSIDPQGVREVQFSDIKPSAYREEEMLKGDMRYASGIDDFSMGVDGAANSATAVRHLRESTLERVRLFVNHLGDAYADVLRYWMDMTRQLFTKEMTIRIVGDNGKVDFPLIAKDDLMGRFDYRAKVLPSIAGQMDMKKKQDMDLLQLLMNIPDIGIDNRKLVARVLADFGWSLDSISQDEQGMEQGAQGMEAMMAGAQGAVDPEMQAAMSGMLPQDPGAAMGMMGPQDPAMAGDMPPTTQIPASVLKSAMGMLRKPGEDVGGFAMAGSPINLLNMQGPPPTVRGVPPTTNPRGFNRGGRVNTDIAQSNNSNPEAALERNSNSLQ